MLEVSKVGRFNVGRAFFIFYVDIVRVIRNNSININSKRYYGLV